MNSDTGWFEAREITAECGSDLPMPIECLPIDAIAGRTLARNIEALAPLPGYSSSAMDGWVVSGNGPWVVGDPILAGAGIPSQPLPRGGARPIATGGAIPVGGEGVLRFERGELRPRGDSVELYYSPTAAPEEPRGGTHVRIAGEEAVRGEVLVRAGAVLTPPRIALAAMGGHDSASVRVRPTADVVVLGDEILSRGIPLPGTVRDGFGPQLPSAVEAIGGIVRQVSYVTDDEGATVAAMQHAESNLLLVTGGSSRGVADHARSALAKLGATVLFDSVAMRPGHPVILATLPGGRPVLCLPGNPTAGMMALLSFAQPLIHGMLARSSRPQPLALAAVDIAGAGRGMRLVACALVDGRARPTARQSPGMLRGLADAELVLVVPPAGVRAGDSVAALPIPW